VSKKRFRELKGQTSEQLNGILKKTVSDLFSLSLAHVQGERVLTAQFWKFRKDIAMIKTIHTQKAREQS
jgi:ribosomal protein L29